MLNLQFYYILFNFLPFLILNNAIFLMLINYFFYLTSFLNLKLPDKKKKSIKKKVVSIDIFILSSLIILVDVLFLFINSNKHCIPTNCTFIYSKYIFFSFIFLSILIIFLNYLFKYYYNKNYTINYNSYIGIFLSITVYYTLFSDNFLTFFLYIEIMGYIYYLQFLQKYDKLETKKLKNFYLDSFLLYYWLNFLSSVILLYFIISIFYLYNTSNFLELNYLPKKNIFIFILGFSLKLGIAGFHFLKVEIYKNLRLDSIINFSFFSLLGYFILLKFIVVNLNIILNFNFLSIIFLVTLFFLIIPNAFKLNNFVLFFGYSAVLNGLLCFFII